MHAPQSHKDSPVLLLTVPVLVGKRGAFETRSEMAGWARLMVGVAHV